MKKKAKMDRYSIEKTYRFYAPIYDFLFGNIFNPGRKRIVDSVNKSASRKILELGVGTGISIPFYSRSKMVIGVDVSPHMLYKARKKMMSDAVDNATLFIMDAENMAFRDNSFDTVILMYTISVVPDPEKVFQEVRRICKAGGDIFVLNHFSSTNRMVNFLEKLITPLSHIIGFKSNFPLEENILNKNFRVLSIDPVNIFGYWTLVHMKNETADVAQDCFDFARSRV